MLSSILPLLLVAGVQAVSVDPDMDAMMLDWETPIQSESQDVFLYNELLSTNPLVSIC